MERTDSIAPDEKPKRSKLPKTPKIASFFSRYAKWLVEYIDPWDWAHTKTYDTGRFEYNRDSNELLERFYCKECSPETTPGEKPRRYYPSQRISQQLIGGHLRQNPKVHYTSLRKSGFAFLRIDIDAHDGQTDAFEAAQFILHSYFPDGYLEPTTNGYAIYVLLMVGILTRVRANNLIDSFSAALATLLNEHDFAATVEVQGKFTIVGKSGKIIHRAHTGALPLLPHGESDLKQLVEMSIYFTRALERVIADANAFTGGQTFADDATTPEPPKDAPRLRPAKANAGVTWSPDAFNRMNQACFNFTVIYRRLPDVGELLEHYERVYDAGPSHQRRAERAAAAIKLRAKTFDPALATDGGFSRCREQLVELVRTFAVDRTCKYRSEITDEDLAIALFTVQLASFGIADQPKWQLTVPANRVTEMFATLKAAGETKRCASDRHKITAMLLILVRAKLIECIDPAWQPGGKNWGIGKKYHVGINHPRYAEFMRFIDDVDIIYIAKSKAEISIPHKHQVTRTSCSTPMLQLTA